jgi:hypothetical protein
MAVVWWSPVTQVRRLAKLRLVEVLVGPFSPALKWIARGLAEIRTAGLCADDLTCVSASKGKEQTSRTFNVSSSNLLV